MAEKNKNETQQTENAAEKQAVEKKTELNKPKRKMTEKEFKKLIRTEEEEHLRSTLLGKKTPFDITEAYKAMRTNIMFSLKSSGQCKTLIVSSGNPGEGKSTTTANIAIAFAQMGDRVLLIDADMRKPRMHRYFSVKNRKGLSNILGGFETLENCINHIEEMGLDVLPAGNIPPNPAELLASGEMDALLQTLSGRYDYVFFDTPPINVVTDAAILSKKVNGVVLVVRHNITNKDVVERSLKTLEFAGARVLGLVFNAIERKTYDGRYSYRNHSRRYGYGKYGYKRYGYSNKYGYGKYGYSYGYGDAYDEDEQQIKK